MGCPSPTWVVNPEIQTIEASKSNMDAFDVMFDVCLGWRPNQKTWHNNPPKKKKPSGFTYQFSSLFSAKLPKKPCLTNLHLGCLNRRDVATKVTFDPKNPPLKAPTPLSSAKLVSKGSCCLSAAGTSSFGFQTKWWYSWYLKKTMKLSNLASALFSYTHPPFEEVLPLPAHYHGFKTSIWPLTCIRPPQPIHSPNHCWKWSLSPPLARPRSTMWARSKTLLTFYWYWLVHRDLHIGLL